MKKNKIFGNEKPKDKTSEVEIDETEAENVKEALLRKIGESFQKSYQDLEDLYNKESEKMNKLVQKLKDEQAEFLLTQKNAMDGIKTMQDKKLKELNQIEETAMSRLDKVQKQELQEVYARQLEITNGISDQLDELVEEQAAQAEELKKEYEDQLAAIREKFEEIADESYQNYRATIDQEMSELSRQTESKVGELADAKAKEIEKFCEKIKNMCLASDQKREEGIASLKKAFIEFKKQIAEFQKTKHEKALEISKKYIDQQVKKYNETQGSSKDYIDSVMQQTKEAISDVRMTTEADLAELTDQVMQHQEDIEFLLQKVDSSNTETTTKMKKLIQQNQKAEEKYQAIKLRLNKMVSDINMVLDNIRGENTRKTNTILQKHEKLQEKMGLDITALKAENVQLKKTIQSLQNQITMLLDEQSIANDQLEEQITQILKKKIQQAAGRRQAPKAQPKPQPQKRGRKKKEETGSSTKKTANQSKENILSRTQIWNFFDDENF